MNNSKICISIAARTAEELYAKVRQAEKLADVIEIRFDALDPAELVEAVANVSSIRRLLATYRSPEQGGMSQITFEQRREFWKGDLSKFWAIDIEEDLLPLNITHSNKIVSYHDLIGVPEDLHAITTRLVACDARMVKIAVTANDAADAIDVWKRFTNSTKPLVPIAMGESGKWTRILAAANGAPLTYASLDVDSATAGGQLTGDELIDIYRVKEINRDTRVYGVIGDPVSLSRSPQMHNAAFKNTNINAVFIPLQVKDVDSFFTRMVLPSTREVELNFAGFAITMPHKESVIKYLDEIDPVANAIGAVNTIKIAGDRLVGYNTDADGFIGPLRRRMPDLATTRVAILGAGGAARACLHALRTVSADITVFARNPNKIKELDAVIRELSSFSDRRNEFEIVINATPVGMAGQDTELPLTPETLAGVKLVYDLVTRASDTRLIALAKGLGIDTIDGLEMLVEQGAKQFEIWTGQSAPVDVMKVAAQ